MFVDFFDLRDDAAEPPGGVRPAGPGVLVVGPDDWSIRDATVQLERAGCTVHRCSDSADSPFPCRALLPDQGCPLDTQRVDLVVAVRLRPRTEVSMSEMGVVCGVRAGLPLVSAGPGQEPLEPWATPVDLQGDLVQTCLDVVRARR